LRPYTKVFFDDVIALKSVKQDGMFLRVCEWQGLTLVYFSA